MADAHSTVDLELGKVQSYIFEILCRKHFDVVILCVQTELHILMWGERHSGSEGLLCGSSRLALEKTLCRLYNSLQHYTLH